MAATLSCPAATASITTYLRSRSRHHKLVIFVPNSRQRNIYEIRCNAQKNQKGNSNSNPNPNPTSNSNSSTTGESEPENMLLKMAWYGSELLGIAASLFRLSSSNYNKAESEATPAASIVELSKDEFGVVDRAAVVENIKDDFQRSYFVTGNLTLPAYEEDCEFADPAGSFRGLRRFKRNCSNFGLLLERSNMKLMKWEDFEDKGIGHWRFSCTLVFPWKPILSATGYTEYYFNMQSGKVCRHVEHWNVPKKALFKQILRPTKGLWSKKKAGS